MKKVTVLDMAIALNELIEDDVINQFEELDNNIINKIIARATEVANEE